jgi:methylmalonyl-CoA/ethylmalonyl-CoA epimerase
MLGRIDHIGVATEDLDGAVALYEGTMGMPVSHRETVESQGVEAVLLDVGEGHVDLREALDKADGWTDIETEDGAVALDLRQVVFLRGAPGEHHIGFTG